MQPKSPKLLADVRDAAGYILQITQGKTLADYETDRMLRQTVERNFEIIGEALNRLRRGDQPTADRISDAPHIIAFRNLLIHGYDLLDHAKVWNVVANDVAKLLETVDKLLAE